MKPQERPIELDGITGCYNLGCGKLYVIVNFLGGKPYEVFAKMGHAGGCSSAQLEFGCRMISLNLRSGVDPNLIITKLEDISCPGMGWEDGRQNLSCPDVISKALKDSIKVYNNEEKSS